MPPGFDRLRLDDLMAEQFDQLAFGEAHAVVIIREGRLIFERYGPGHGPDKTCLSWSKAKSITQALAGILVGDGRLDLHAPADVSEWQTPLDPRAAITSEQLNQIKLDPSRLPPGWSLDENRIWRRGA